MERRIYNADSLTRALREFEDAYGLPSEEFYAKHLAGEDLAEIRRFDRHVWASFYEDVVRMEKGDDLMGRVGRSFAVT
jgi:hypothetical protein